jgi:hypothetical protein
VEKAGDINDKPRTDDDAKRRRMGEQEIGRGMLALGRVEFVHKIIWRIILPEVGRLA